MVVSVMLGVSWPVHLTEIIEVLPVSAEYVAVLSVSPLHAHIRFDDIDPILKVAGGNYITIIISSCFFFTVLNVSQLSAYSLYHCSVVHM